MHRFNPDNHNHTQIPTSLFQEDTLQLHDGQGKSFKVQNRLKGCVTYQGLQPVGAPPSPLR